MSPPDRPVPPRRVKAPPRRAPAAPQGALARRTPGAPPAVPAGADAAEDRASREEAVGQGRHFIGAFAKGLAVIRAFGEDASAPTTSSRRPRARCAQSGTASRTVRASVSPHGSARSARRVVTCSTSAPAATSARAIASISARPPGGW